MRIAILLLSLGAAGVVSADSLRCGNDLVLRGDHLVDVRDACGEPLFSTPIENEFGAVIGSREVHDPGYGRPRHEVIYRDSVVTRIKRLR